MAELNLKSIQVMDNFTIGILLGVTLMMAHQHISAILLFRSRRKDMEDAHRRQIELFNSYNQSLQQPTLAQQLQEALERQDFEEAARIRNLMERK